MQSVYIETTIPSYYFETRRTDPIPTWHRQTQNWWSSSRQRYRLVTSDYVVAELSLAPRAKAEKAIELIANLARLRDTPRIREIAEYYVHHKLMPQSAEADAIHLAMASVHRIDFLLTWNCQHLANANKIRHLTVLNGRLGVHVPIITTPLTLMHEAKP